MQRGSKRIIPYKKTGERWWWWWWWYAFTKQLC